MSLIHNVLREGRPKAGDICEQLLAGGIKFNAHAVDAITTSSRVRLRASCRVITLHLPFAENNERSELAGSRLSVEGGDMQGGSAGPVGPDRYHYRLPDFSRYAAELSDGPRKVLSF